jgi:hypothetical protein
VDQVEVQVVELEPLHAGVEREQSLIVALVVVPELGRDENLLARHPRLDDRGAHLRLIAINGGRIDVSVTGLECGEHRALGLAAGLPHTEPDLGHACAAAERERYRGNVFGHGAPRLAQPLGANSSKAASCQRERRQRSSGA